MAFLLALLAHMRSIEMITARQGVHQEQSDMIKSCAVQALPCKKASRSARSCDIRWRAARVYGALLRVWAAIMIIMYSTYISHP